MDAEVTAVYQFILSQARNIIRTHNISMDKQYYTKCAVYLYIIILGALLWITRKSDTPGINHAYLESQRANVRYKPIQLDRTKHHPNGSVKQYHNSNSKPYHNEYTFPNYVGPGAGNKDVIIQKNAYYQATRNKSMRNEVNTFMSDVIGMKRILSDSRPEKCRETVYPDKLPEVSIVVIFRDEPVSNLLRTVYSVLETSPEKLVNEVILVDDGSEDLTLQRTVDIHVENVEKLKLVRNERSLGLMMARQKGIDATISQYFIVLDGHIEVTPGWLEPIIYRLVQQPNALLTSHIGVIDRETFHFSIGRHDQVFIWFDQLTLGEQWVPYTEDFIKTRNGSVEPIDYVLIPGMMVAMRKAFFLQLGGFDPGMEVWGTEHMELSVKVWLCGGRVEMVPCSRLGHLYRPAPWQRINHNSQYLSKNMLRFILVWMDGDLQSLALEVQHKGNISQVVDAGDVQDRHQLRIDNKCKPYQYYIDQIIRLSNVFIPRILRAKGVIFNKAVEACLDLADIGGHLTLITYQCSGNSNQFFVLTEDSNIRVDRAWFEADSGTYTLTLSKDVHDWSDSKFKWSYEDSGTIKHMVTGKCLTTGKNKDVFLETCIESPSQKWEWPPEL